MTSPWEDYPNIWKNKAAYFTWLRGGLRRIWSKSPVKIAFIQQNRKRIPSPRGGKYADVWGGVCNICEETFQQKHLQVDHIVEAGSLRDYEDITGFVTRLLSPIKSGLRLVCKPCHTIHTYSSRKGISFDQARVEKEVIAKCKMGVGDQRRELLAAGFSEDQISNAKKRRGCYTKLLEEGL